MPAAGVGGAEVEMHSITVEPTQGVGDEAPLIPPMIAGWAAPEGGAQGGDQVGDAGSVHHLIHGPHYLRVGR